MLLHSRSVVIAYFFFLNDPATTEIYPLPLHDPLPISTAAPVRWSAAATRATRPRATSAAARRRCRAATTGCARVRRSEEHTSELQSQSNLVCRLLLEKKIRIPEHDAIHDDALVGCCDV